jgi:hypothetical protein
MTNDQAQMTHKGRIWSFRHLDFDIRHLTWQTLRLGAAWHFLPVLTAPEKTSVRPFDNCRNMSLRHGGQAA